MDTTEKILLIVLAAVLALFLILAIVAVVLVIKVLKGVNRITDKAERIIDSAETVGQIFKQSAEQMSFIRLIRNIAEMVGKHHKSNKKE